MRVLWSVYELRQEVEPLVALAVGLQALGTQLRPCAPYCAAAEGSGAPAATAVIPTGVRP